MGNVRRHLPDACELLAFVELILGLDQFTRRLLLLVHFGDDSLVGDG